MDAASRAASSEPTPPDAAAKREIADAVLAAVRALPDSERLVTTLFYIDGYSQADVAAFLDVPVGTVKSRLHKARERLKQGMMTMVENTLRDNALPEGFPDRLLAFPFPRTEPTVEIVDVPGETLRIRCEDMHCYFTPLVEHGMCDWTFYDWPGGRLTGVYERRIVGVSRRGDRTVFREWGRFVDPRRDAKPDWGEGHALVENDTWRWVDAERTRPGEVAISERARPGHRLDPPFEAVPMELTVGTEWGGFMGAKVIGVADVSVGSQSWRCLKVTSGGSQHYKSPTGKPTALAEWYIAETGRTVFFRRYNGPDYAKPDGLRSFESLEGMLEVEHEGVPFRHSYDCIPDVALEHAFD